MKLSFVGRWSMALFASLALGLGMTACGGGTIGYMWVLGQQYNQIVGFKVDQYSGNLTEVPGAPFASNGSVPVSIVVKQGGRYVYVVNQGSACPAAGCGTGPNTGQSIALFSVGGDGTLSYQQSYQSQGYESQWAQMDSSGTYLYVLDKYSPGKDATSGLYDAANTDGNGSISVFAADPNTGRLSLVTNSQTQVGGVNTPFWEVGPAPIMSKSLGGCLFTLNTGVDKNSLQTVTPFSIGSNGQLVFTTTGNIEIASTTSKPTNLTSIAGPQTTGGSLIFMTDAANNVLYGYSEGGSCGLTALNGGTTNLGSYFPNTSNPVYSMIDSSGKYIYVLNQSTTSTNPTTSYSSISPFSILPTNQELQPIGSTTYQVGSGPVCMVEDPTNQYVYVSSHNDGTVTGRSINQTTGELAQLSKGSTFTASGLAGCLVISGAVN
jgi:6-phosphogluconolactonase (cycloisomerase 2 family)